MPTAVRSHAKINLGLSIGAPRPDGFHGLATVYQTIEIHDTVTVSAHRAATTTLRLSSNDSRVPIDSRNTAWRMVTLALDNLALNAEVEIHIEKRLPVQGGLGAGSANAVAALIGLEKELELLAQDTRRDLLFGLAREEATEQWRLSAGKEAAERAGDRKRRPGQKQPSGAETPPSLQGSTRGLKPSPPSEKKLSAAAETRWAAQVGSDVPLFLIGGTVLGTDRGQEVYPLPDIPETWCIIVAPPTGISTPQAFRDWDALCAARGLTAEASAAKLNELSRAYASAFGGEILQAGLGSGSSGVLSAGGDLAGPQESVLVRTGIVRWIQNDFEQVVFPQHPSLSAIKRLLAGAGTPEAAILASLSGSGSALFGLYNSREDAEAAQARVKEQFEDVEVRITRTLPRSRYWREMLLEDVR